MQNIVFSLNIKQHLQLLYFIYFLFLPRSPKKDSKEDRMFKEKANNKKKEEIETLEKKSETPGW